MRYRNRINKPRGAKRPSSKKKKDDDTFQIEEAGVKGRQIFNDILSGITDLEAIRGMIRVEVDLSIEDENLFKDDEIRNSKLIVEVELARKKDKPDGP